MMVSLNGRLRAGIILLLLLILAACLAGLAWNNLVRPAEVTEKVKVYSYQQAANIDYQVNLLPNNFLPNYTGTGSGLHHLPDGFCTDPDAIQFSR